MSKALKKLIDINRLREFKNKLVGAGSAYVQTSAVDQTIAGTKTFSKPIVGSVTGNAATATKATQDAAGNTITTTYATKAENNTKANNSEVVHKSGNETISGAKTFTGNIIGINKERSTEDANSLYSTTAGSKLTYYTASNGGTKLANVPAAVNTTLESRTIRILSDSDWVVEQICHNSNGLYYRKGSNGTWGAWKTFAFTDSNISGNAATATTATTAKACTGNSATATKATQDSAGQQIDTTYIKGLAVSGRTITYTKGDGSTGTITTQDTNTWTAFKGATSSANGTAGYVPAPTKGNQGKFFKADGTWATPPNTTYASMSASEATTGTATAARTISAKVLHDKINSNLSAYATKTELNNGLTAKANDSAVVHKSGDETITGTKTFSSQIKGNISGSASSVPWSGVTGKPSTFTPSSHTHDDRYYTESEVNNLLNGKANTSGTYSNLTVGNAGSATNATYANWLRTSSHSDHLFHTEWDGKGYFWTYVTAGNGDYRAVRVARSDSATNADHATKADSAATASSVPWSGVTGKPSSYTPAAHTHDDRYYTESEVNNLLNGKANDNAVVHKSGNESIAGTKTFNDSVHANGFHSTTPNAFMAQRDGYTLVIRNDGYNTYFLMSDKDGVPGTWSNARPLTISNSTGVCDINGNASTATKAANADHATKADSATKAISADRASAANCAISNSRDYHEIRFDWDSQVSGCVGLRVDTTDMGGIVTTNNIRAQWYAAYPDGPEAHNAMWGGRDITAAFNNGTVSVNIANGTFHDIFPGDYITKQVTISGTTYTVNWVVADCDYWWHKGDQNNGMETHHVVIVPQQPIFKYPMNGTNNTVGGYAESRLYTSIIPDCTTGIVNAFGSSHILTFRDHLTRDMNASAVPSGITVFTGASNWNGAWYSQQCNLMSEAMVYDGSHCASSALDNIMATRQMSAFRLSEKLINYNRQWWWLRDVVSSEFFAAVDDHGGADAYYASARCGVRPFALLK